MQREQAATHSRTFQHEFSGTEIFETELGKTKEQFAQKYLQARIKNGLPTGDVFKIALSK